MITASQEQETYKKLQRNLALPQYRICWSAFGCSLWQNAENFALFSFSISLAHTRFVLSRSSNLELLPSAFSLSIFSLIAIVLSRFMYMFVAFSAHSNQGFSFDNFGDNFLPLSLSFCGYRSLLIIANIALSHCQMTSYHLSLFCS